MQQADRAPAPRCSWGTHSALGNGEEPGRFAEPKWLCTTRVETWSGVRQEHGIHDWHWRCGQTPEDGQMALAPQLWVVRTGEELPSPEGSASLSSRPPPASAAPGSERYPLPTAEGKSPAVGADPRARSGGQRPRAVRCRSLAHACTSSHRTSEPLLHWPGSAEFS